MPPKKGGRAEKALTFKKIKQEIGAQVQTEAQAQGDQDDTGSEQSGGGDDETLVEDLPLKDLIGHPLHQIRPAAYLLRPNPQEADYRGRIAINQGRLKTAKALSIRLVSEGVDNSKRKEELDVYKLVVKRIDELQLRLKKDRSEIVKIQKAKKASSDTSGNYFNFIFKDLLVTNKLQNC